MKNAYGDLIEEIANVKAKLRAVQGDVEHNLAIHRRLEHNLEKVKLERDELRAFKDLAKTLGYRPETSAEPCDQDAMCHECCKELGVEARAGCPICGKDFE